MKIAVVAWGSLIWEPKTLRTAADFVADGPLLPIEFCRISTTGARRDLLTLVIDPDDGSLCKTYAAPSALTTLDEAIQNLAERERMKGTDRVGFVETASGRRDNATEELYPETVETIAAWAQSKAYDAAIWTALPSNFEKTLGEPFSVTAALAYMDGLKERDAAKFSAALDYIRNAPPEVDTAVRDGVARRWPG